MEKTFKSPDEFKQLSLENKIVEICDNSIYLSTFLYGHRLFQIYAYGNQYIELIYNITTRQCELICILDYSHIDKYLEKIDLNSLNL